MILLIFLFYFVLCFKIVTANVEHNNLMFLIPGDGKISIIQKSQFEMYGQNVSKKEIKPNLK